jgi:hypothetical protein
MPSDDMGSGLGGLRPHDVHHHTCSIWEMQAGMALLVRYKISVGFFEVKAGRPEGARKIGSLRRGSCRDRWHGEEERAGPAVKVSDTPPCMRALGVAGESGTPKVAKVGEGFPLYPTANSPMFALPSVGLHYYAVSQPKFYVMPYAPGFLARPLSPVPMSGGCKQWRC